MAHCEVDSFVTKFKNLWHVADQIPSPYIEEVEVVIQAAQASNACAPVAEEAVKSDESKYMKIAEQAVVVFACLLCDFTIDWANGST